MTLNNQSNDSDLQKLMSGVKSSPRMILRDDPIGSYWGKGDNGQRTLERVYADGDNYWAITTEELQAIQDGILKARIDELRNFDPFFKGDHSKCPDKMTCIGYQNAQCDFENECEIRVYDLQSQLTKSPKEGEDV